MLKKEEFQKMQQEVESYRKEFNRSLIKNHICISCKKQEIKPIGGLEYGDHKASNQDEGCWDGGGVARIEFGYGSNQDGEAFFVAICDDCIVELEQQGLATNIQKIKEKEDEIYNNIRL